MYRRLTDDVIWIAECYDFGDVHMHLSVYLLETDDEYVLVDTGSYYHQEEITAAIGELTDGAGPDALVFANTTLEHTGNLGRFREEWGEFRVITSADMPAQVGMPDSESWKLGRTEPVAGRDLTFIRPPFTDVLYSMWLLDEPSGTLFTAEAFGHLHREDDCTKTSAAFADGFDSRLVRRFYAQQIPWLEYAEPAKLRAGVAEKMTAHDVERIAPVHGNPIVGDDIEDYLARLEAAVEDIAVGGNLYDDVVTTSG